MRLASPSKQSSVDDAGVCGRRDTCGRLRLRCGAGAGWRKPGRRCPRPQALAEWGSERRWQQRAFSCVVLLHPISGSTLS